ncbi:NTP transferase domain-containing protein [candidate division KSB1 bacterium]|nr:NTP transferase domain-containing protein [candidate division KSB1 bacterium]
MQAVLMVAGKSTRTYPLTLTRPKPILPFMNKPLIEHSLDQLEGLFDEVILIVGYRQEMIKNLLGDRYKNIKLIYQEQKQQLGTGHAVLQARPYIKDKFVAMNGDDLFAREDLEKLLQLNYGALVKRVDNPNIYGVYHIDKNNKVLNLVEKPKEDIGDLVNIGCYVLQPEFMDELEKTPLSVRGEIEITSTILSVAKKQDVFVVPVTGFWRPTGYAWDLLKHQEYFMPALTKADIRGTVEPGVTLKGAVSVGTNTLIKAGVYIEGPVIIGDNCEIGPNCYIRPYTSIGDNCRIGNAVEIKNSIIMAGTTIAHLCYIGDSVIGYNCNIGGGTITANKRHDDNTVQSKIKDKLVDTGRDKLGAIISDDCRTGINTSIYPGRKLWPEQTTRPGEIVDRDIMPENAGW